MGWTGTRQSIEHQAAETIRGWTNSDGSRVECIGHELARGGHYDATLFAAMEFRGGERDGRRFLIVSLFEREHGGYVRRKDMDESCGPNDARCPVWLLDLVPDPGAYATAWRERCRAHAAEWDRLRAVADRVR